ncbi:MAG: acyl-phosphate glycerol 3-phosphate acyltransferase [Bacteriovoracaceae bacterium]|nr:acyl-phosphate glycerol 3-phosphate acyltransferase [Bacteriovoracaceae bacterium]
MTFYTLFIFSYVIGAVPFGLLLGRLFADVDVRSMGSGNIGATNVNRVLGRKLGAATLLCDILKGFLCVILAMILLPGEIVLHAWVGFAAFLGHCFPIYLNFKGGKGVATAFGVLMPISPGTALGGLLCWLFVARLSRISSLGAIVSSSAIPFLMFFFTRNLALTFIFALMMGIVIYRHKENIQRLRAGTELR